MKTFGIGRPIGVFDFGALAPHSVRLTMFGHPKIHCFRYHMIHSLNFWRRSKRKRRITIRKEQWTEQEVKLGEEEEKQMKQKRKEEEDVDHKNYSSMLDDDSILWEN